MSKQLQWFSAFVALIMALALSLMAYQGGHAQDVPALTTPYQAVALSNGQVFFGRIAALNGNFTELRDVFYIQTRQNPETKEVANVLVKRGNEAHGPDRMILNRQQVLLIEPVKEDSKIGQLIREQSQAH